jgi:exosome complex RNA-binding protein Csl4
MERNTLVKYAVVGLIGLVIGFFGGIAYSGGNVNAPNNADVVPQAFEGSRIISGFVTEVRDTSITVKLMSVAGGEDAETREIMVTKDTEILRVVEKDLKRSENAIDIDEIQVGDFVSADAAPTSTGESFEAAMIRVSTPLISPPPIVTP